MNTKTIKSLSILVVFLATVAVAQKADNQTVKNGLPLARSGTTEMFRVNQDPLDMVSQQNHVCPSFDGVWPALIPEWFITSMNCKTGTKDILRRKAVSAGSIIVKENRSGTEDSVKIVTAMRRCGQPEAKTPGV
jgi:hypothetical protein